MNTSNCEAMALLIQADIDGELRPAEAAPVAAHRLQCAQCERTHRELLCLHNSLREDVEQHTPAPDFRARLLASLEQQEKKESVEKPATTNVLLFPDKKSPENNSPKKSWRTLSTFGAGAALAASLMLFITVPNQQQTTLVDTVVAGHIRALQPGHLLDVVSTDQHNVKPWFDGKLDFAPPVKNLADVGFPLQGGRLDYLNGRPVAALVYTRGKHPINLFVCPESGQKQPVNVATGFHTVDGYNVYHWRQDDMLFWAVSDLNPRELGEFIDTWKTVRF